MPVPVAAIDIGSNAVRMIVVVVENGVRTVVKTEREGLKNRLPEGKERAQREEQLAQLPPDPAGKIKGLQDYDFVDPEARRLFEELLQSLQQQMLQPFLSGMKQSIEGMTPQDMQRMREMLRDLNRMLREKLEGGEPDFQRFKDTWGESFPGVESFDQLMEQIGRQMAQMQSLLQSMSPEQRQQLEAMMRSLFLKDERLEAELRQLGMQLGEMLPLDEMTRQYRFRGDDELSMQDAMQLMDELAQMEQLEQQILPAGFPATTVPFSMVFGPHNIVPDREQRMFTRILSGRPVLIPGDGTSVGMVGHVDDQVMVGVAAAEDQQLRDPPTEVEPVAGVHRMVRHRDRPGSPDPRRNRAGHGAGNRRRTEKVRDPHPVRRGPDDDRNHPPDGDHRDPGRMD